MTRLTFWLRILLIISGALGMYFKLNDFYRYGWHSNQIAFFLIIFSYIATIVFMIYCAIRIIFFKKEKQWKFLRSIAINATLASWGVLLLFVFFISTLPLAINEYPDYKFITPEIRTASWHARVLSGEILVHFLNPIILFICFGLEIHHQRIHTRWLWINAIISTVYIGIAVLYEWFTKREVYYFININLISGPKKNLPLFIGGFVGFIVAFIASYLMFMFINNYLYIHWSYWQLHEAKQRLIYDAGICPWQKITPELKLKINQLNQEYQTVKTVKQVLKQAQKN